jgi:hypothetical protein
MATGLGEEIDVAKKRAERQPESEKSGEAAWKSKPIIVQLRGSEEFKAALEKVAELDGLTVSGFVDRAIRDRARQIGYTKPLPKR